MSQQQAALPGHVGIIMDGNGRWAKKRGLSRMMGHRQGVKALTPIVRHAKKVGIKHLTVYAFSTENWKRPKEEVDGIMNQLRDFLSDADKYSKEGIRLMVLGDTLALADDIRVRIAELREKSSHCTEMTLNIALNYGGRDEILRAAREYGRRMVENGMLGTQELTEAAFSELLYTAGQPDVDLVIRTSGEMRMSNFLLWQSAYAEYYFTETLWPDFKPRDFDKALASYFQRSRRLGGIEPIR